MGLEKFQISDAEQQRVNEFLKMEPEPTEKYKKSGVYVLFDAKSGEALWVGESDNVFQRLTQHHERKEGSNLKGQVLNNSDSDIDLNDESLWHQTEVKWLEVDENRASIEKVVKNRLEPRYGSE